MVIHRSQIKKPELSLLFIANHLLQALYRFHGEVGALFLCSSQRNFKGLTFLKMMHTYCFFKNILAVFRVIIDKESGSSGQQPPHDNEQEVVQYTRAVTRFN